MTTLQLSFTFEQVLSLVKQLSQKDKIKLGKELEKEGIANSLATLLQEFQTDELSFDTITNEVEAVRQQLYEK